MGIKKGPIEKRKHGGLMHQIIDLLLADLATTTGLIRYVLYVFNYNSVVRFNYNSYPLLDDTGQEIGREYHKC